MKINGSFRNVFAFLAVTVLGLLLPVQASAKYSKASSKFSYGGVEVEVVDRHQWIGLTTHTDTYGYAIYKNHNDQEVEVYWKGYGVRKGDRKLVCLSRGKFNIPARKEHKEVYSYGGGKYTYRDFEGYVVSIDVKKVGGEDLVKETAGTDDSGSKSSKKNDKAKDSKKLKDDDPNASNTAEDTTMDAIYNRFVKHEKAGTLDQKDYSDGIQWMNYQMEHVIKPLYYKVHEAELRKDEAAIDRLHDQYKPFFDKWMVVGAALDKADKAGKLNESNKNSLKILKDNVKKAEKGFD